MESCCPTESCVTPTARQLQVAAICAAHKLRVSRALLLLLNFDADVLVVCVCVFWLAHLTGSPPECPQVALAHAAHAFTNTADFTLRCGVCQVTRPCVS